MTSAATSASSCFVVFSRGFTARDALDRDAVTALEALGARFVRIEADAAPGATRDLDGRLVGFLADKGWDMMIVRPDFYLYGGTTRDAAAKIATALCDDLAAAGVHLAGRDEDARQPHIAAAI